MTSDTNSPGAAGERRTTNKRTAMILLSIALAFFAGVIAKFWLLSGA